jgi:LacI family transcriptional regulator
MSTISEIAKAAKVSPATVSRVFNRYPHVTEDLKSRVLEAASSLGYAPKFSSTGNSIAVMVGGKDGLSLSTYENILTVAISRELFKKQRHLEIITDQHIPFIHGRAYRAIIVLTSSVNDRIPFPGINTIAINNNSVGAVHSVSAQHAVGIEMAVDYLVKHGHKNIGFISGATPNWGNKERYRGFLSGLEKNNLQFDPRLFAPVDNVEIFEACARMLTHNPTAIILSGEGRTLALNHALFLMNKKIPNDVSVISFEEPNVSGFLCPAHTTIDQGLGQIAETVVDLIFKIERDNPVEPVHIALKNKIIERNSVKDLTI